MVPATGFTVVELMVTIAVVAVLAAIALPNFRTFMRRNSVATQANSLYADMQMARSQAITRRGMVSLCPRSASAAASDATCATGTSKVFDNGWLVYAASAPSAAYSASPSQPLLHLNAAPDTVSIRSDTAAILTFSARGELVGSQTHLMVCYKPIPGQTGAGESSSAVPGKQVTLEASGRASVADLAAGASCQ